MCVQKHAATVVREIVKHTPELAQVSWVVYLMVTIGDSLGVQQSHTFVVSYFRLSVLSVQSLVLPPLALCSSSSAMAAWHPWLTTLRKAGIVWKGEREV